MTNSTKLIQIDHTLGIQANTKASKGKDTKNNKTIGRQRFLEKIRKKYQ